MMPGTMRILMAGWAVCAVVALPGCGGDGTGPTGGSNDATLTLTPSSASLRHPGDTIRLRVGGASSTGVATWSSSDAGVVAVDPDGLATAAGYGTATVKVRVQGLEASAAVSVVGDPSLAFLEGTWSTEDVAAPAGLAPAGTLVVSRDQGALRGVWRGSSGGAPVEVVTLVLQRGSGWTLVRADGVRGTFAVMDGSIAPGEVTLDSGSRLGGAFRERTRLTDFTSTTFRWSVEESGDGGATWTPVWIQLLATDTPRGAPTPLESPSPACGAPEYGQFDFWMGDWTVKVPSGGTAGTNLVHRIAGCGIQENWRDAQSGGGVSLNMYDPRKGLWAQFYAASTGGWLELYGGLQAGNMVLATPGSAQDRVTWSLLDDGRVRQHWQRSDASGAYSTYFDGYYNPR